MELNAYIHLTNFYFHKTRGEKNSNPQHGLYHSKDRWLSLDGDVFDFGTSLSPRVSSVRVPSPPQRREPRIERTPEIPAREPGLRF